MSYIHILVDILTLAIIIRQTEIGPAHRSMNRVFALAKQENMNNTIQD